MEPEVCHIKFFCARLRVCVIACLLAGGLAAQVPFKSTGQVFAVIKNTNELHVFTVQAGYNSSTTIPVGPLPAGGLDAVGFRRTDRFLYGIGRSDNHLYRIGEGAVASDLGAIGLDNNLRYLAGDVTPDGRYLLAAGSTVLGNVVQLVRIDLTDPAFGVSVTPLSGVGHLSDLATEPSTGQIYGYDMQFSRLIRINPVNNTVTPFGLTGPGHMMQGVYFDAFGDLYAVGSTLYGVVQGFFQYDLNNGIEKRMATGALADISDLASAPYSVELSNIAEPSVVLPCTDVLFNYTLVNSTGETLHNMLFSHQLPAGFTVKSVQFNSFGGVLDTVTVPGTMRMELEQVTPGEKNLTVKINVGDIPKSKYNSQATLEGLPDEYGKSLLSDFIKEAGFEDSTAFFVNRFEEDTLSNLWFVCHGETISLDATDFGGSVAWSNGTVAPSVSVGQGGMFTFKAATACEEVFVRHDVTSASCPYTISVLHTFEPDTIFACSDVSFRFAVRNESGEPRFNVSLCDTLPEGFTFGSVVRNPFGGVVTAAGRVFCIDQMNLPVGTDTVVVLVHAENITPGTYSNRAYLNNLPLVMGPFRQSDNPFTFPVDSSRLVVKGALSDSLFLVAQVCPESSVVLDAGNYGETFLWDNGEKTAELKVSEPGTYYTSIFDGCEPAWLTWEVLPAPGVVLEQTVPYRIHQGEEVQLNPVWDGNGMPVIFSWSDPWGSSLTCMDCAYPVASPLHTTGYVLKAENGYCSDSLLVLVEVDESRRIYAPNIFSPNDDGENDLYFLQSPDETIVRYWQIFDRWGSVVFEAKDRFLHAGAPAWDGRCNGKDLPEGVYTWVARLEFLDKTVGLFTGDVMLVR
jgi:gliding motility-associated-like protein